MKKAVRYVGISLATAVTIASAQVAQTPPMGWNSYDCFMSGVTETQVKANADYMAANLKQFGWQYIVIDYCWFYPNASGAPLGNPGQDASMNPRLYMDANGRLTPDVGRFPSAANGQGFKPLADYVHGKGLKFGIHLMRGVPRQAVYLKSPVLGTSVTADQVANTGSTCGWINTCYGLNMSKPEAQTYLNSCFALYAQWGVDFVKVDDLSQPYYASEVVGYRNAITSCGREICFSLSPGGTPLNQASHVQQYGNMWRIIGDFWDNYSQVVENFSNFNNWEQYAGPGHWPDGDMLPLGMLTGPRMCGLSHDEQTTVMSLWSIARGPLMFGGNLPQNDAWTLALITNDEVLRVNQNSANNHQVTNNGSQIVWYADDPGTPNFYLALFNTAGSAANVTVTLSTVGVAAGESRRFRDLWTKTDLGVFSNQFSASVPAHGARVYKVTPGVADNTPPSAPANLVAQATAIDTVRLRWSKSSDSESGILKYCVYRDGAKIAEVNDTAYIDTGVNESTTYGYQVSAVNGMWAEGAKCATVNCTTPADNAAPTIALVSAAGANTQVRIIFSEPVEQASAQTAGNYAIDNSISVSGASLGADLTTVTLTVAALTKGVTYTLTANNVRDRAKTPNTIAANTKKTFQYIAGITRIRYYPRDGYANRMVGGVFEGTNGNKDTGPYTTIYTISSEPPQGQWTEATSLASDLGFRYVRYRAPAASYGNIAEIEFYRGAVKATGALFGTAGSWGSSGNDYAKAFDGNVSSYWDYSQADGAYAGLDLESNATVEMPGAISATSSAESPVSIRRGSIIVNAAGHHTLRIVTLSGATVRQFSGMGKQTYSLSGIKPGAGILLVRTEINGRNAGAKLVTR